jgi:integrase
MINVKFYLKDKKSKTKTTIRTSVSYNGKRFVFCPGYSIDPVCWDFKNRQPKSMRNNQDYYGVKLKLLELETSIRQIFEELTSYGSQRIPIEVFQQKVMHSLRPNKFGNEFDRKSTLIDFIDVFIKDSENGKRLNENQCMLEENTIKPYRSFKKHMLDFEERTKRKIEFSDVNQDLIDEFSHFLIDDLSMSKNSHSKYMMVFLQIIKYAIKKNLFPSSVLVDMKFYTSREETDNIYLNKSEIQLLMDLKDFKSKTEEEVRDMFVVGCYTGLRFSDFSQIKTENIIDGVLHVYQKKTKQRVQIPIHVNVQKIIDKYGGRFPLVPTNQEFNRTLKDIGMRVPEFHVPFAKQITRNRRKVVEETKKWENLTTHTARRSFCTNMYLMGAPVITIMAISGHKSEKSFRMYIKATQEEHAKKMKDIWDKKG